MVRIDTKVNFKKDMNKLKTELKIKHKLNVGQDIVIDKNRQIKLHEKEILWDDAHCPKAFDSKYFRQDILGNICIKGKTVYKLFDPARQFCYHIEHLVSHSNGGRSSLGNTCLLNAGVNMSKGKNELWSFNYYWILGLFKSFAIHSDDLLHDLDCHLHDTCQKYDIYFQKNDNSIWSINAMKYTGQYANIKNPVINENKGSCNTMKGVSILGLGAIAIFYIIDYVKCNKEYKIVCEQIETLETEIELYHDQVIELSLIGQNDITIMNLISINSNLKKLKTFLKLLKERQVLLAQKTYRK